MSKVLVVLVLLLGAAAAYVATRPDAYHVERSTTVDAPAATVFAQIDDLSVWKEWSPWEKKDPAMKRTFSATSSGVGASYSWEGAKILFYIFLAGVVILLLLGMFAARAVTGP